MKNVAERSTTGTIPPTQHASQICRILDDPSRLFTIIHGLGVDHLGRDRYDDVWAPVSKGECRARGDHELSIAVGKHSTPPPRMTRTSRLLSDLLHSVPWAVCLPDCLVQCNQIIQLSQEIIKNPDCKVAGVSLKQWLSAFFGCGNPVEAKTLEMQLCNGCPADSRLIRLSEIRKVGFRSVCLLKQIMSTHHILERENPDREVQQLVRALHNSAEELVNQVNTDVLQAQQFLEGCISILNSKNTLKGGHRAVDFVLIAVGFDVMYSIEEMLEKMRGARPNSTSETIKPERTQSPVCLEYANWGRAVRSIWQDPPARARTLPAQGQTRKIGGNRSSA